MVTLDSSDNLIEATENDLSDNPKYECTLVVAAPDEETLKKWYVNHTHYHMILLLICFMNVYLWHMHI